MLHYMGVQGYARLHKLRWKIFTQANDECCWLLPAASSEEEMMNDDECI